MPTHLLRTAFNTGVLSPLLDARLDVDKVAKGCRQLQNFVVRPHGGAFKRPGFRYLGNTKNNQATRLMPFNFDQDTKFVFALTSGAMRFWTEGEEVTLPITSAFAWSGTTVDYTPGQFVHNSGVVYGCKTTHTPTSGNQPPGTNWTTTDIKVWQSSTAYVLGDIVQISSGGEYFYICTTAHTSSSSADLSKFTLFYKTTSWLTSTAYAVGAYVGITVSGNYRWFRCKSAHTSGASTQPGTGASWTTYWTEYSTIPSHSTASLAYKIGDPVKVGTDLYFATSDHTSSASNEPTDAGSPWKKVTGVKAWDGTSTARATGDIVFYAGMFSVCHTAYTSGTYWNDISNWVSISPPTNPVSAWSASPTYQENQVVSDGANKALYLCLQDHTTLSTTQPGTTGGEQYWQKLRNVFYWNTSSNYIAGQYVFQGSTTYRVVSDHTAGTFATDLAAGKLVAEAYILELETAYAESELFDVNYIQINDVVWLLHPNHETKLLTRFGNTAWRLASISWDYPPMRDENVTEENTITSSGTTGDVTLTASTGIFNAGHVGSYFAVGHRREQASIRKTLSAQGNSSSMRMQGRWDIYIYGTTWVGEVTLQYSYDNTNWFNLRSWQQPKANMRTVAASGTFEDEVFVRIRMSSYSAGGTDDYAWLEAADARVTGMVKITSVSSPTIAAGTVISGSEIMSTAATSLWAEAAYSDYRGWPRTGTLHEGRLTLAGSNAEPQIVRFSATDDFFNFKPGSLDTSSLSFQIASKDSNAIRWIESVQKTLAIGTVGEEWVMTRSTESKTISPTNPPNVEKHSRRGSSRIQAVSIGDAVLHLQNDNFRVREFSYDYQKNGYQSIDLSELAEHITKSGIKQVSVVRQPDTVLYVVTNDGRLLTLTYDRIQNVVAWAEHITNGSFESVASIYGGETNADEVWVAVKRTIGGTDYRFVERMDQDTCKMRFEQDEKTMCYLDASVIKTGASSVSVTGLSHLNGASVYALADGKVQGPFTVSAGAITLTTAASTVLVGLTYTALLQGVRVVLQLQDGTSEGRKIKATRMTVMTYQSNGFEMSADSFDASLPWRNAAGSETDISLRTSEAPKWFPLAGIENRAADQINWTLRSSKPLPVNILAVEMAYDVFGN